MELSPRVAEARRELARELLFSSRRRNPFLSILAVLVLAFAPLTQIGFGVLNIVSEANAEAKLARLQGLLLDDGFYSDWHRTTDAICYDYRDGTYSITDKDLADIQQFYERQFAKMSAPVVVGSLVLTHVLEPGGIEQSQAVARFHYRSLPFRWDFQFGSCVEYSPFGR